MTEFTRGALPYQYWLVENNSVEAVHGGVIDESLLSIYVNAQEVATIMCSPVDEESLVVGFLYNEGVIQSLDEIALLKLNNARTVADAILSHSEFSPPRRLTITSGCGGGGISLENLAEYHPSLESDFTISQQELAALIPELGNAATLYNQVRGVHTAVLVDKEKLLLGAEDVGRHNTIDKIAGKALQTGIETHDKILLSSGRISSEMASKARRLQIPLIVSRTAPTSIAIKLSEIWQICLVGYARRQQFRVYTHAWRLGIGNPPIF